MRRQIVLASSNPGKLREFRALLTALDFVVIAQDELGIDAAEEPHLTFVENALAKARHAAARSGLPALADDSGCACRLWTVHRACVRRASPAAADDRREQRRTAAPAAETGGSRAHYTCVLVAVASEDDPEPVIADARWYGEILRLAAGIRRVRLRPALLLPELAAPQPNSRRRTRTVSVIEALRELAHRLAAW